MVYYSSETRDSAPHATAIRSGTSNDTHKLSERAVMETELGAKIGDAVIYLGMYKFVIYCMPKSSNIRSLLFKLVQI